MPAPSKKTASRCTTEAETGTHTFEIVGYSLKKGIGVRKFVQSATFAVGGYEWAIRFYPDGLSEYSKEYVSIYLQLVSKNAEVRARCVIRLVPQVPTKLVIDCRMETPRLFSSLDASQYAPRNSRFCLRSTMENEVGYICNDCLTIECAVTVVKVSQLSDTSKSEIEVLPCDISQHFAKLLDQKDGSDVTFCVGDDTFEAHKIVLAARSPVFKAEFYGQMKETRMSHVTIKDMQPAVFEALLHFIYTGCLNGMDDLDGDEYNKMIWYLLAAADRYAIDRLKVMCESILSRDLQVDSVATTLALADQHNCNRLKEVCIEFITSSNAIGVVLASQGYAELKRTCPAVLGDILENTSKRCKTKMVSSSYVQRD